MKNRIQMRTRGFVEGKGDILGRNSNLLGSIANGMSPSRCARTSSWMTEVLFSTYTFSIAIVGTYATRLDLAAQ